MKRTYNGYQIEEVKGHFLVTTQSGLFIQTADTLIEAIEDIEHIEKTKHIPDNMVLLPYSDLYRLIGGFYKSNHYSPAIGEGTRVTNLLRELNKSQILDTLKARQHLYERGI